MIGIPVTKTLLDQTIGSVALELKDAMDRIETFKQFLDTKQVADLEALGYSTAEANTIQSAFADAEQLRLIFTGTQDLTVAKDFQVFLRQCWGIGRT